MQSNSTRSSRIARLAFACLSSLATLASAVSATPLSDAMGFETLGSWSQSSGNGALSTTRTQGTNARKVSGFYYTELLSPVLTWTGGGTSDLALDVNLPAGTTWGNITMVATAPSAQAWEQIVGQVSLPSTSAAGWTTLHFPVPAALQPVFQSARNDLQFKIRLNLPWSDAGYILDNLRFVGASTASKVEIRLINATDLVYLQLNGLRKRVSWNWQYNGSAGPWVDVSSFFVGGVNNARVQATAAGANSSFELQVRVDGGTPVVHSCASGKCDATAQSGMFYDQPLTLSPLNLPAAQTVRVTSKAPGKIYVDDEYTGLTSPATLTLPRGTYKIGVGISTDAAPNYTGSFYEKSVTLGATSVNLDMGTTAMPKQNTAKIAILPIGISSMDNRPNPAILTQGMIDNLKGQIETTRSTLVVPFSYGLTDWNVTVLPIETAIPMHSATALGLVDEAWNYVATNAKYAALLSEYDIIVVVHSTYDASGNFIADMGNRAGSAGQVISYPINWSWPWGTNHPLDGLLHETLHQYESQTYGVHHLYLGVDGLHGAGTHGFTYHEGTESAWGNTEEWLTWYKTFMRGQAGETSSMRTTADGIKPTIPGYYVGTFSSVRYGRASAAPR
jgi:hypothetical protein